jgi:hypothetical protein
MLGPAQSCSQALPSRCSTRLTLARCHLPPSVIGISRASNSAAMALNEVRRVSIRTTVVCCHLQPRAVGIRLRFSLSASARREREPAAISFRMVGAKVWARESAARLPDNGPLIPRLRDAVISRTCFIRTSWLDLVLLT